MLSAPTSILRMDPRVSLRESLFEEPVVVAGAAQFISCEPVRSIERSAICASESADDDLTRAFDLCVMTASVVHRVPRSILLGSGPRRIRRP